MGYIGTSQCHFHRYRYSTVFELSSDIRNELEVEVVRSGRDINNRRADRVINPTGCDWFAFMLFRYVVTDATYAHPLPVLPNTALHKLFTVREVLKVQGIEYFKLLESSSNSLADSDHCGCYLVLTPMFSICRQTEFGNQLYTVCYFCEGACARRSALVLSG